MQLVVARIRPRWHITLEQLNPPAQSLESAFLLHKYHSAPSRVMPMPPDAPANNINNFPRAYTKASGGMSYSLLSHHVPSRDSAIL